MTEVTCSAFIVDFNWNCIAEFTGVTSSTVDTTNGRLTLADTTYIYPTGLTFGEVYYQFNIQCSAASGSITLYVADNEINITNAGVVAFNGGTAESYTIDPTNAVNVELLVNRSRFVVPSISQILPRQGVIMSLLMMTISNRNTFIVTAWFFTNTVLIQNLRHVAHYYQTIVR